MITSHSLQNTLDSVQGNHETKQMMEKYNGALSGLEASGYPLVNLQKTMEITTFNR